ncbi:MAG: hemerythrin domain-containing protein [Hydrogenobacter thermophilus]|uniref:hemerythrin domain-containing protein n=1 Tax=Hydrogenobacter thermophilus TaxID=940 RepID=UPI000CC88D73|nr:hemerythrin domain-containing protein [Hydrogenobacter thermophilus]QWK20196.1 MAG: hemerythrin domain-containing protein [Hydrogenobacter thermophilus]GBC88734.1 Iron-sulfur cluster repair protein YtfE [bacterium HR13]
MGIKEYLTDEHRECDKLYAKVESLVQEGNWGQAEEAFRAFKDANLLHFKREEDVLFPAFEETTGIVMGPTQVMRMEHAQARDLMDRMEKAIKEKDKKSFLSLGDTFMVLLQQHNMKEEQILYPMCDQHLVADEVIEKMKQI